MLEFVTDLAQPLMYFAAIVLSAAVAILIERTRNVFWIVVFAMIGCLICFLVIAYEKSVLPTPVDLNIIRPETNDELREFEIMIEGTVLPEADRVFVLVHPRSTQQWYVQDLAIVDPAEGTWRNTSYLGTRFEGCRESYDIIALASIDSILRDIVRDRILVPGDRLKFLPVLSRSNQITVHRTGMIHPPELGAAFCLPLK